LWTPYYDIHRRRIEGTKTKFGRFALSSLRWKPTQQLPPYCQRIKLIKLDFLYQRRQLSSAMFVRDVLSSKLDCPKILSMLNINIYRHNARQRVIIIEDTHRTIYGKNAPLKRAKRELNYFSASFDSARQESFSGPEYFTHCESLAALVVGHVYISIKSHTTD
jgi:hypothetical protein